MFSTDLSTAVTTELIEVQERFVRSLVSLADARWGRVDRIAVDAVTVCVVDIPTGLLRRPLLAGDPIDAVLPARLERAVRAVLTLPLEEEDS